MLTAELAFSNLSEALFGGKVSKCSDLLYAFQTNVLVRPLLFPRSHSLIQSWFSQLVGTLGLWHAEHDWLKTTDV